MYYFASTAYGEEPRLFWDPSEVEEELARLKETVAATEERLLSLASARATVEALPCTGEEAGRRDTVAQELWEAEKSAAALLEQKRERLAALSEEWAHGKTVR